MKVTLEKYGGIIPLAHRPKMLETATLPKVQATELKTLIAAAIGELTSHSVAEPRPGGDKLIYKMTISEGDTSRVLYQSDGQLSPSFAALLRWVNLKSEQ